MALAVVFQHFSAFRVLEFLRSAIIEETTAGNKWGCISFPHLGAGFPKKKMFVGMNDPIEGKKKQKVMSWHTVSFFAYTRDRSSIGRQVELGVEVFCARCLDEPFPFPLFFLFSLHLNLQCLRLLSPSRAGWWPTRRRIEKESQHQLPPSPDGLSQAGQPAERRIRNGNGGGLG